jgi:hypothetical protein
MRDTLIALGMCSVLVLSFMLVKKKIREREEKSMAEKKDQE